MTLEEFLRWDDGTDTHYELIGGFPVAMAPPAAAHRILAMRLGPRIDAALAGRRPCNAQGDAGIIRPDRADTYFEADIAATCEHHEFGQQALKEPFLIVEILSPSTERHDRRIKLPVYRQIDTVQEILLIDPDGIYAELHRRAGAQWITDILRGPDAVLSLASAGMEVRLSELYEGIELAKPKG
ncbi:MAG: Uma2 family endonuclease [Alphaproteobacteria bacterium]